MLHLKRKDKDPPGGWFYIEPTLKVQVVAGHFAGLVQQVQHLLAVNEIVCPENIADIIEDSICQRLPSVFLISDTKFRLINTYNMVHDGTLALLHLAIRQKNGLVPLAVAERRAEDCVVCPFNSLEAGCIGCTGLHWLVQQWFHNRSTSLDSHLHVCHICGCLNQAQVHVAADILISHTSEDRKKLFPTEKCWKGELFCEKENTVPEKT
jgi:hypothetical protein